MSKGKKKKKFARCRPENQSKGRQREKRESDITGIIKKTRASSTKK
jgi:hypothetical protein